MQILIGKNMEYFVILVVKDIFTRFSLYRLVNVTYQYKEEVILFNIQNAVLNYESKQSCTMTLKLMLFWLLSVTKEMCKIETS